MVGTCTKFRYHSRPIHRTPLMHVQPAHDEGCPGMVDLGHLAGDRADDDDDDDEQHDAGADCPAG